ncbi:MAG: hypothetical protein IKT04_00745 [Clostridia bacterium]|nr:hypothetical protein [Clostridia bacterium]
MVLSLFSLGAEMTHPVRDAQIAIENAFKQVLDEQYSFKNFSNEKTFVDELSNAVANDSIIVAATEPAYYKAFKKFVCNAFLLKCKPAKQITSLIEFVHPELSDEFIAEQAEIPANATPLLTQDGLYSGFGIKAKKQLLIVLPLDDKRIDYVINNSLFQFLRENMDLSVFTADPLEGMTEEESPLAHQNKRVPGQLYDALLIKQCVKKLKAKDLTIALADTKTVDFVGNISATDIDLSDVIFVSEYSAKKEDMSEREYAINLAKGALINSSNDLGGAITKVFALPDENGMQQYFMYVCIADEESTNVAKLTAEPDETPPELIYRAVEELFRMISVWADTGYTVPPYTPETNKAQRTEKRANKKLSIYKIVFGASLAVASIASIVIAYVQSV